MTQSAFTKVATMGILTGTLLMQGCAATMGTKEATDGIANAGSQAGTATNALCKTESDTGTCTDKFKATADSAMKQFGFKERTATEQIEHVAGKTDLSIQEVTALAATCKDGEKVEAVNTGSLWSPVHVARCEM